MLGFGINQHHGWRDHINPFRAGHLPVGMIRNFNQVRIADQVGVKFHKIVADSFFNDWMGQGKGFFGQLSQIIAGQFKKLVVAVSRVFYIN